MDVFWRKGRKKVGKVIRRSRWRRNKWEFVWDCARSVYSRERIRKARAAEQRKIACSGRNQCEGRSQQILKGQLFFRVIVVDAPAGSDRQLSHWIPRKANARREIVVVSPIPRRRNSLVAREH